jgi:NUMOD3 motif
MLINKYSKTYFAITSNAKQRITEGYTELHHIIPQSMGGSNDKENLVELTAREHFVCHWLLIKMTEGKDRSKMLYALNGMKAENRYQQRYNTKITARVYETYRIEHAENHSKTMKGRPASNKGRPMSDEQKQLLREKAKANHANGKVYSKESQEKRIAKVLGQKRTDETKRLMSLSSKGKPKGPMSEEQKQARSITMTGQRKTKSHATNVANAVLGNISINKDGFEKKVKQDTLQSYLDQGWQLGGKKRKLA